ncbi:hypothetical protein MesoLj113b_73030 (plasmid) [Mesorhizobium sp. 113-3-3]|nr:hypothetical protein MesoLj113b_73030 [Mesorhizobium sp. 113-3-3]
MQKLSIWAKWLAGRRIVEAARDRGTCHLVDPVSLRDCRGSLVKARRYSRPGTRGPGFFGYNEKRLQRDGDT